MRKSKKKQKLSNDVCAIQGVSNSSNAEISQDDTTKSLEHGSELMGNCLIRPPMSKNERIVKELKILHSGCVPKNGFVFKGGIKREAGDFLLGPILGSSPVKSMVQCLGRKKGTDEFYTLKILTIRGAGDECQDDKQGKMLLHTEHSLLSFLKDQPGILKEHGLFEDYACDATFNAEKKKLVGNGRFVRRVCLVLDCVIHHSFDPSSTDYINLQHYVIGKRRLKEMEALTIFYDIVSVVKNLHDVNVIHRDLKLANLVLNRRNRQIILTNFCLGQHLVSENDKLLDQRGSPAYISPDVLIGKPYLGKPSDMWALGVVLFTMLFGQFPFYHKYHQELFKMIKTAQYTIPNDGIVKADTLEVIRSLLCLEPSKRVTASELLVNLNSVISARLTPEYFNLHDAQVVPNVKVLDEDSEESSVKCTVPAVGKQDDFSSNKDDGDVLEYLINRTVPQSETEKPPHSLGSNSTRNSGSYCYSTGNEDLFGGKLNRFKRRRGISIIEGDIRNFSQKDLFVHRSIFPQYSGSELFGGWRKSGSGPNPPPPPTSPAPPPPPSCGTSLGRIGPQPTPALRTSTSASRLSLSSVHISSSNATPPMYEFPPNRRWALTVMQQLNNPSGKPPTVPQMEINPTLDGTVSSTTGIAKETSVKTSSENASNSIGYNPNSGTLTEPTSPKPSCSGLNSNRDASSMHVDERNSILENLLGEPGLSHRLPNPTQRFLKSKSLSNLASLRTKKILSKLSNKDSSLSLQLNLSSTECENSSSGSNSSSSSSSNSSLGSTSSVSASNEYPITRCGNSNFFNLFNLTLSSDIGSATNNNNLPIDPNNNTEDINNNNDDNNNSDNNNFNIPNNNLIDNASTADPELEDT